MDRVLQGVPKLPFAVLILLLFTFVIFLSSFTSVSWAIIESSYAGETVELHEGLWDACVCADFTGQGRLLTECELKVFLICCSGM